MCRVVDARHVIALVLMSLDSYTEKLIFKGLWKFHIVSTKMNEQSNYVPPAYVPLGQSDLEAEMVRADDNFRVHRPTSLNVAPWSSGICACCDDMQSCCIGLVCPCYLFAKNAEFLGSGTFVGSCMTHFILWALVNSVCCLLNEGLFLGLPGCFVACYACGYRRALRSKFNLQEAPCGDFVTHFFCHLCAVCQEYREIRERCGGSDPHDIKLVSVTAPSVQIMESSPSPEGA